ncbi:hypothetical protein KY363_03115 [Candidatus Woesearchaeota archaeon]|nr:hypothetical protein [Candidatus Woesearchaeota archaeon]
MEFSSRIRFFLVLALALAICSCIAYAQSATESNETAFRHKIDVYIEYNKVLVESKMVFGLPSTGNVSVELPFDARRIHTFIDDKEFPAILDGNEAIFPLNQSNQAEYAYITEDLLEGNSLIANFIAPLDTELLRVELSLPEKATLDKPLKDGSVQGSSAYPKPKRLETDGQVIKVIWDFEDVKKGDDIALYVRYKKPLTYMIPLMIIIAAVTLIILSLAYLAFRKRQHTPEQKPSKEHKTSDNAIETHLKEDEQQVVNVLKLKEGSCEQGTLRIATGFSKSKLSTLLTELEQRNIIHKEKRGKKNLVFLK